VDSSYIYYCESGFLYQLGISEVQNIEMAVPVYDIVLTTNVTEKSNIFKEADQLVKAIGLKDQNK